MTLKVIGAGFGRTGTMSLRMALDMLGFGPCYHMENVLLDIQNRVPHWNATLDGSPDWDTVFDGFNSAVDWPVAAFWQDLMHHYPDAKFILSSRSPESWCDSISQTILTSLTNSDEWPEQQVEWLEMAHRVVVMHSLGGKVERDSLIDTFNAHEAAVRANIPADRLLVHQAKDGWEPLCEFLGQTIPSDPYPRSNNREEFFELIAQNSAS